MKRPAKTIAQSLCDLGAYTKFRSWKILVTFKPKL